MDGHTLLQTWEDVKNHIKNQIIGSKLPFYTDSNGIQTDRQTQLSTMVQNGKKTQKNSHKRGSERCKWAVRVNERTVERVAQHLRLDSWWIWPTVLSLSSYTSSFCQATTHLNSLICLVITNTCHLLFVVLHIPLSYHGTHSTKSLSAFIFHHFLPSFFLFFPRSTRGK